MDLGPSVQAEHHFPRALGFWQSGSRASRYFPVVFAANQREGEAVDTAG